jgi:phage terminase small subunit
MPAPKSNEHLRLHGTFRKGRHTGRPSRSAPLGKPSTWLDAVACDWWRQHAAQLEANGAGAGDVSLVESAAKWYSIWRSTLDKIEAGAAEYREWCKLAMAWKAFAAAASRLGIGPTDRSRIRAQGASKNKLSEFLANG